MRRNLNKLLIEITDPVTEALNAHRGVFGANLTSAVEQLMEKRIALADMLTSALSQQRHFDSVRTETMLDPEFPSVYFTVRSPDGRMQPESRIAVKADGGFYVDLNAAQEVREVAMTIVREAINMGMAQQKTNEIKEIAAEVTQLLNEDEAQG